MVEIFGTFVGWALIVFATEALWRKKLLRGEYARKAVHISLATWIAFLPYYLSWTEIKIMAVFGLAALVLNRAFNIFKSVYDIKRQTWGDIIGPAAMLIVALFEPSKVLFALVVLHIGLGDGLAAVIGTRFGRGNQYKILGYTKSVAGTTAFFVTSIGITSFLIAFSDIGSLAQLWPMVVVMAAATTLVENISVYGADNASIALTSVIVFNLFV
jgi:dolichol kinase